MKSEDSQGVDALLKRKSLFLSPDKVDEWHSHFHFIPEEVRELVLKRNILRMQRLFDEADAIKAQVWDMGYGLRDSEGHIHIYLRRYDTEYRG